MSNDPFVSTIMPLVRKNKSYMEIVFRFEQMAPQLKRTVAASFLQELSHELEKANPGWLIENQFKNFDQRYEGLSFRRNSWPKGWAICMEMGQSDFRDFCIGFCCPSKTEQAAPSTPLATEHDRAIIRSALEAPLLAIGHNVRDSESWPAYCWLPAQFRDWRREAFLLLAGLEPMPDDRTALRTFVDWFKLLVDALGEKIDEMLMQHTQGESP